MQGVVMGQCSKRLTITVAGRPAAYVCNNPLAAQYKKRVDGLECDECMAGRSPQSQPKQPPSILPDGTIVYQRLSGDWEPPPLPAGYRRKPDDSWTLEPVRPLCPQASFTQYTTETCGWVRVKVVCDEQCQDCPHRGNHAAQ